jgi:hypothetical protein
MVGLLSPSDLAMIGSGFRAAFPVQKAPVFEDLVLAIDKAADRAAKARRER